MSDLKEFKRVMDEERRKRAAAILPEEPEKEYRGKWRNLWFSKSGESWPSARVFDSENDAKMDAEKLFKITPAHAVDNNPKTKIKFWSEVSHAIQMPIGGGEK